MDFIRLDKVSAREDGGVVMHVVSEKPLDNSIMKELFRRIAEWTEFHHARFSWIVN